MAGPSLVEIGSRHGTDKGTRHSYLVVYDQLFVGVSSPVLLEIGIDYGGSMRMWRERFPGGQVIGIDNDPRVFGPRGRAGDVEGCQVYQGDATDKEFVRRTFVDGSLDIVIDDGSHRVEDQILSLCWFWGKLRPGGLYVVEDVLPNHTGYFGPFCPLILDRNVLRPDQNLNDDVLVIMRKP